MRALPMLLAICLGACGADLRRAADGGATPSDAGARDGPSSDVGGACAGRIAPGLPCAASRPCLGEDRCNDCFCTGAVWVCGSRVCVDAGVCPPARPRTGDACAAAGQACAYGAGCAGASCVCAGGRWTCDAFYCPDR